MNYEENFRDYEKLLHDGILDGFVNKQFQKIYEYLYKRKGVYFANQFMMQQKRDKRLYCAKLVLEYIDDDILQQKAQKYIDKCNKRKAKK